LSTPITAVPRKHKKKYGLSFVGAGDGSGFVVSHGRVRTAMDKVRYACGRDEVNTFRSYLSVHIGTINMMLAEHGFQRLDRIASTMTESEEERNNVKEKMAEAQEVSNSMQTGLFSQLGALFNVQAVMDRLLRMMSYDVRSTLSSIKKTVAKLWLVKPAVFPLTRYTRAHRYPSQ
jgi:hypothetical protein